ncbi:polysaccharide deacetylase family protein [Actinospica sp.]|uniref:polysaccharide deacetylase family protein n=1 Tax=Actinospica sp. TaxID=1872142 RepID=UPI002CA7300A|nr:polysaccharide deacetylase family protein [Actinospica sp.]HWG27174.1 polysaccharide deacetylase family protein [Actinospica sp.]
MSDEDLQRTVQVNHAGQPEVGDAAEVRRAPRRKVVAAIGGVTLVAGVSVTAGIVAAIRDSNPKTTTAGAVPTARRSGENATPSPSPSITVSHRPATAVATKPQYYVDNAGPKAIALTMDDGPHPVYTPQVLEILRDHGIKATFNMIGSQVGANLSIVREVSAAGHTITNHTWNHADLTHETYKEVCSQMDRCNDALAQANQSPSIFRAPYGNWSGSVFQACASRGLQPVDWSVDPRDWDTAHVDTQDIVHTVLRTTRAHDIILEHDGGGVRRNTVAAMKIFIPKLIAEGYNFVAM